MLRRLALAALLALWPALVSAQVAFVTPTAPTATNNNQIASTAWVRNFIAAGGVVLVSGTGHGDSIYSIAATDRYVYTNAAFTAPRIWTLPAANSLAAGTTIWVQDAQGTVTTTNTLTISRAGADTIDIANTTLVITGAGGGITFTSDGVSNWGTPIQTPSTGGTGRITLTNHAMLVGAGLNPITQLPLGTTGQLMLGVTGADPAFATMSQDCTVTVAGVITCTKTNNVAFGPLATQAIPCTVAQGCTGDTGTAWTTFTPTPLCNTGTGTWTVNSAKSKALGKTINWELDFTLTSLGTCSTSAFNFTAPIISNSGAGGAGRETAVVGTPILCSIPSASTTITCFLTTGNLAASEHFIASGVYESQ